MQYKDLQSPVLTFLYLGIKVWANDLHSPSPNVFIKAFPLESVHYKLYINHHMDISENSGTPKWSILKGFSIINHPFWGPPIFGNTHMKTRVFGKKGRMSYDLIIKHWPFSVGVATRKSGLIDWS